MLRDGGSAANAPAALHVVFSGDFHGLPIETMVLVEARVFSGDDGVLKVRRDLAQRNELVVFVVGLAVNEGLQAALHVHSGRGRVNPFGSHEGERGQRPCGDEAEGQA